MFLCSICSFVDDDDDADPIISRLNAWFAENKRGSYRFRVDQFESPESMYASRETEMTHVQTLRNSFLKSRSVPDHCIVVIWLTDAEALELDNMMQYDPLGDPQFMDGSNRPEDADTKCYVVAGDHSTQAMQSLNRSFPKNPTWQTMKVQVLVLERTEANYEMCLNLGNMDNQKNKHLERSTLSVVRACRGVYLKLEAKSQEMYGMPSAKNNNKEFKKLSKDRREAFCTTNAIPPNSFKALWTLITHTQPVQDLIERMFTGDVQHPKSFKKCTTTSQFNQMGGISDDLLQTWLESVTRREINLKQFQNKCKLYKCCERVKKEIFDVISSLQQYQHFNDFDEASAELKHTCDDTEVQRRGRYIKEQKIKSNADMPDSFKQSVLKTLKTDARVEQMSTQQQEMVS